MVPAYNAQATITETLESVTQQTFTDFELIVVDDGSTDATSTRAAAIDDSRVRVILTENGGVARARNRGINEARGQHIAFIDADDLWRPTKLQRQLDQLDANADAGVCVTAAMRIDGRSRELGPIPLVLDDNDICTSLLLYSMVAGCVSSGLVRRSALETAGLFNPAFSQCADWDLWLRLSRSARFLSISDDLVLYRVHSHNMSGNVGLLESDTFAVLDAFYEDPLSAPYLPLRDRVYSNHWMICSGSYLHTGKPLEAVRCLMRGLRAHPANVARPLALPRRWLTRLGWRRQRAWRSEVGGGGR